MMIETTSNFACTGNKRLMHCINQYTFFPTLPHPWKDNRFFHHYVGYVGLVVNLPPYQRSLSLVLRVTRRTMFTHRWMDFQKGEIETSSRWSWRASSLVITGFLEIWILDPSRQEEMLWIIEVQQVYKGGDFSSSTTVITI